MCDRVPIEMAYAAYYFQRGGKLRNLIHDFKYHDDRELAKEMGRRIGKKMKTNEGWRRFDMVVPVPLSRGKKRLRGYNQSALLAAGLSEITGAEVCEDILVRKRYSGSQTHLNAAERARNTEGAFELGTDAKKAEGRSVLLLDDVFTTGATAESCLRKLSEIEGIHLGLVTLGYRKD